MPCGPSDLLRPGRPHLDCHSCLRGIAGAILQSDNRPALLPRYCPDKQSRIVIAFLVIAMKEEQVAISGSNYSAVPHSGITAVAAHNDSTASLHQRDACCIDIGSCNFV